MSRGRHALRLLVTTVLVAAAAVAAATATATATASGAIRPGVASIDAWDGVAEVQCNATALVARFRGTEARAAAAAVLVDPHLRCLVAASAWRCGDRGATEPMYRHVIRTELLDDSVSLIVRTAAASLPACLGDADIRVAVPAGLADARAPALGTARRLLSRTRTRATLLRSTGALSAGAAPPERDTTATFASDSRATLFQFAPSNVLTLSQFEGQAVPHAEGGGVRMVGVSAHCGEPAVAPLFEEPGVASHPRQGSQPDDAEACVPAPLDQERVPVPAAVLQRCAAAPDAGDVSSNKGGSGAVRGSGHHSSTSVPTRPPCRAAARLDCVGCRAQLAGDLIIEFVVRNGSVRSFSVSLDGELDVALHLDLRTLVAYQEAVAEAVVLPWSSLGLPPVELSVGGVPFMLQPQSQVVVDLVASAGMVGELQFGVAFRRHVSMSAGLAEARADQHQRAFVAAMPGDHVVRAFRPHVRHPLQLRLRPKVTVNMATAMVGGFPSHMLKRGHGSGSSGGGSDTGEQLASLSATLSVRVGMDVHIDYRAEERQVCGKGFAAATGLLHAHIRSPAPASLDPEAASASTQLDLLNATTLFSGCWEQLEAGSVPEPADVALVTAPAMHAPAAEMVHMLLDSPEAAATGPTAIAAEASAAEALAAEALATPSQAAAEGSSAPPSAHGQPVRSARHATRHAPGRNHGLRFRSGAGLEAGVRGKARSRGRAGVMSEAAAATAEKGGNVGDGDKRQYSDINDPPEWLLVKKLEPPGLPTTPPPPPLEMPPPPPPAQQDAPVERNTIVVVREAAAPATFGAAANAYPPFGHLPAPTIGEPTPPVMAAAPGLYQPGWPSSQGAAASVEMGSAFTMGLQQQQQQQQMQQQMQQQQQQASFAVSPLEAASAPRSPIPMLQLGAYSGQEGAAGGVPAVASPFLAPQSSPVFAPLPDTDDSAARFSPMAPHAFVAPPLAAPFAPDSPYSTPSEQAALATQQLL